MGRRHDDDYRLYQEFLEASRNSDGVENREEARKKLAEELATKRERLAEFADARATRVADGFDESHKPELDGGQMAIEFDTYLVIGDSERVRADRAMTKHTRQWLDVQNIAKAKHDAAHAAKTLHGYKLLAIQDEKNCSLWQAMRAFDGDPE